MSFQVKRLSMVVCMLVSMLAITLLRFSSPVSASVTTITVTVSNLTDIVDGDTSSISALISFPGADGISLREAVQAANNTTGSKVITFDPALSGKTIVLSSTQPSLTLTSGDTLINGDLNGDGNPDITIDGANGDSTHNDIAFVVRSGGNTIQGFTLVNFYGASIRIGCDGIRCNGVNLSNNKILGNWVNTARGHGFIFTILSLSPSNAYEEANNITIDSIEIRGNHVVVPAGMALFVSLSGAGASYNTLTNLMITNNYFSGSGINLTVVATDGKSDSYNIPLPVHYSDHNVMENVSIVNNIIEPSGSSIESDPYGATIGSANDGNSYNRVSHVTFSGNTVGGIAAYGFMVNPAGDTMTSIANPHSSSNNQIDDVQVYNNHFTVSKMGIMAVASFGAGTAPSGTGNLLKDVSIHDNEIGGNFDKGILVSASAGNSYNTIQNINITRNYLHTGFDLTRYPIGINVVGGGCWCSRVTGHNAILAMTVTQNTVNVFNSLMVFGGDGPNAEYNLVEINYAGNTLNGTYPLTVVDNNSGSGPGNRVINYEKYKSYLPILSN